jgi:hypothetical protein
MFIRSIAVALVGVTMTSGALFAAPMNSPSNLPFNSGRVGGGYVTTTCTPKWTIVGYNRTVPIYRNTCTGQTRQGIN